MPDTGCDSRPLLADGKFQAPHWTATGETRASVTLTALRTLWFNTGSLCNIACENCYIESSPRNDRLAYLTREDVVSLLDEVATLNLPVETIGFTGGEPFMNRAFPSILSETLARGYHTLVLTNAMMPMQHHGDTLRTLASRYGEALRLRVSIDHYRPEQHEAVRGAGTWQPMLDGLRWLASEGIFMHVAGRALWNEPEADLRSGFATLFAAEGLPIDAYDPEALVLFPEMDPARDVPEITTRCWSLLGVSPDAMMCATSRMVVRRKGAERPTVVPCTLLPYDPQFDLGDSFASAATTVFLNHPFCSQFCVLGGASCARSS